MRVTVSCAISMASSRPTMFQAPAPGPFQGTYGGGFTGDGTIIGNYFDDNDLSHGFLMNKHGVFTTYDCSARGYGPRPGHLTRLESSPSGAITGWYVDEDNVNHGFVRGKHGAFVEFDVPGAGTGPGPGSERLQHCSEWGRDRIFLGPGQCRSRLRATSAWACDGLAPIFRRVTTGRPMLLRHSLPESPTKD